MLNKSWTPWAVVRPLANSVPLGLPPVGPPFSVALPQPAQRTQATGAQGVAKTYCKRDAQISIMSICICASLSKHATYEILEKLAWSKTAVIHSCQYVFKSCIPTKQKEKSAWLLLCSISFVQNLSLFTLPTSGASFKGSSFNGLRQRGVICTKILNETTMYTFTGTSQ